MRSTIEVARRGLVCLALAAWLALLGAPAASAAVPEQFATLNFPLGVTTNGAGDVIATHDQISNYALTRFSPAGVPQTTVPFGSIQVGQDGRLATDRTTGAIYFLQQSGGLSIINPTTLQMSPLGDLAQTPIDGTRIYDVTTGTVRDGSGFVVPGLARFGDLATHTSAGGTRLDMFVSVRGSTTFRYVTRYTFINGAFQGAKAIIASFSSKGTDNLPAGVAVNPQGNVLTTLQTFKGPSVATDLVDRAHLFVFTYPEAGPPPAQVFDGRDLSTEGMDADAAGRFYAVGQIGSAACGAAGSAAVVMLLPDGRPLACQPFSILATPRDITISADGALAYETIGNQIIRWRALAPPIARLSAALDGAGGGTITSNPSGISCGATCAADFAAGSQVVLHGAPNPGFVFVGWAGGGCSGTADCAVTVGGVEPVVGVFRTPPGAAGAGARRGRPAVARTIARVVRGRARVTLRCPAGGPPCAGKLRLVRKTGTRSRTWGAARFTIAAGKRKTVSVPLTPAARLSLARTRGARVTARIEVSGRRAVNSTILLKR